MRRIALINQKGGVGKTTTTVNLGAALALEGRRVALVDLDPQSNLTLHLDVQLAQGEPSIYTVLLGNGTFAQSLRDTRTTGLRLVASSIDLSGAELELANAFGREMLLRDALDTWEREHREQHGEAPADYVLLDCPPSLGLLSVNGLVAACEAVIAVQTEFFAMQGMTKLVEVVQLLRRRLNPKLEITGILPSLYDNRTRLAREVLAELRAYFPGKVFQRPIGKNVKLAESPSYGKTIFEYAPESSGASDYLELAREVIAQETLRDPELAARFAAKPIEPRAVARPRESHKPARASEVAPSPALREVVITPATAPETATVREVEPQAARETRVFASAATAVAELPHEGRNGVALGTIAVASPSSFETAVEELPELPPDAVLISELEP
jgi:chromosome partitioning protein